MALFGPSDAVITALTKAVNEAASGCRNVYASGIAIAQEARELTKEIRSINRRLNMPAQTFSVRPTKQEFIQMAKKQVKVMGVTLELDALPLPNDIVKREIQVEQFDGSMKPLEADGNGVATVADAGKWEPGNSYQVSVVTVDNGGTRGEPTVAVLKVEDTINTFKQGAIGAKATGEEFVEVEVADEEPAPPVGEAATDAPE